MRIPLLVITALAALLAACAHGDPLPARQEKPGAPASVKNDPGFAPSNAEWQGVNAGGRSAPATACVRSCPAGTRCVLERGVESCVAENAEDAE